MTLPSGNLPDEERDEKRREKGLPFERVEKLDTLHKGQQPRTAIA